MCGKEIEYDSVKRGIEMRGGHRVQDGEAKRQHRMVLITQNVCG